MKDLEIVRKIVVLMLLIGITVSAVQYMKKRDLSYFMLLKPKKTIFLVFSLLLCMLSCRSLREMLCMFLIGMLFEIAYMDQKTMQVYGILLRQLLGIVVVVGYMTEIAVEAYLYGLLIFLFGSFGVFGSADAYVFNIVLGLIHLWNGNVREDGLIIFLGSQITFLLYAMITGVKRKLCFKSIWRQKLPMIPSIVFVVYLYGLWKGGGM